MKAFRREESAVYHRDSGQEPKGHIPVFFGQANADKLKLPSGTNEARLMSLVPNSPEYFEPRHGQEVVSLYSVRFPRCAFQFCGVGRATTERGGVWRVTIAGSKARWGREGSMMLAGNVHRGGTPAITKVAQVPNCYQQNTAAFRYPVTGTITRRTLPMEARIYRFLLPSCIG